MYAYDVGGEQAVGLIFLARLIPAALVSPFAGLLGDRSARERVLLVTNTHPQPCSSVQRPHRVFADAAPCVVYALAIAATIANTPFRSAQAALTPSLARTPRELTAANAVASGVDSLALFAGPALAGLLLALLERRRSSSRSRPYSSSFRPSSSLLIRTPSEERPRGEIEAATLASEALAGFRTIGSHAPLRVLVGLIAAQTAVAGAVQVYIVVVVSAAVSGSARAVSAS